MAFGHAKNQEDGRVAFLVACQSWLDRHSVNWQWGRRYVA
jgi:hypothetical protein